MARKKTQPEVPVHPLDLAHLGIALVQAVHAQANSLQLDRQRDVVPGYARLKRAARAQAVTHGHELGRFSTSEYDYCMARCVHCLTAAAVVSPTRYGLRFGGGAALTTPCPVEHETTGATYEDEEIDTAAVEELTAQILDAEDADVAG